MGLKALLYAYLIGGVTFVPLLIIAAVYYAYYTSVPVGEASGTMKAEQDIQTKTTDAEEPSIGPIHDVPRPKKGWLTMRRTFEPTAG